MLRDPDADARSFPAANLIDAFDQAPNFGGKIGRQSASFMIQFFEGEKQFGVELIGSGGDKFVHQEMKPIGLDDKARAAQLPGEGINDLREFRWSR